MLGNHTMLVLFCLVYFTDHVFKVFSRYSVCQCFCFMAEQYSVEWLDCVYLFISVLMSMWVVSTFWLR